MAKTWYLLYVHTDKYSVDKLEKHFGVTSSSRDYFEYKILENPAIDQFPLDSLVELILKGQKNVKLSAEDQVEISILYEYDDQCGFNFEPNILSKLGNHNILLTINAYQHNGNQDISLL